ncbi:spore germination protein (amino acid permease) [Paenibacillus sp. yr247]|uniref:GerAB/ArcD/ProY family transporter n=1 Tax=Paenibacillus sp. yr247 TaxID=1761880 RepID=UPI00088E5596|nr:GerAB/ArcD/ProY family transporter [Paenibacillus sp. yr247]SDO11790.1 spore germination protein (amino acid permease) [Paenibacillus sp. yr247]
MRAKLPFYQTTIMANFAQTGVVVFSLPRLLSENIGTNGWIALLICSFIAAFNILLISFVYRLSKGRSIFEIAQSALPKIILVSFFSVLAGLWAILGSLVGKEYILILKSVSFPALHPAYLYIIFEILVFLLLTKGIIGISNAAVLGYYVIIWNTLLLVYSYHDFDMPRMTTFWFKEASHSLKGWLEVYIAFLGYELCLLLFPYANEKSRLIRAFYIANLLTTFSYTLVAFISFGFFSIHQLQHMKYPLLNLLSYLELPFVKRIDDLVFNITIFRVLVTNVLYGWAALETMKWLIPAAKKKWIPYVILAIFALAALFVIPSTLEKTGQWLSLFGYAEVGVAFLLPIFLFILLLIKRGRNYA